MTADRWWHPVVGGRCRVHSDFPENNCNCFQQHSILISPRCSLPATPTHSKWLRHYCWRTSAVVTPLILSLIPRPILPHAVQLHCQSEMHIQLGPRPPRPPQIFGDGCRPPQCHARILLRTHGVAVRQETPRGGPRRERAGLQRPARGSRG